MDFRYTLQLQLTGTYERSNIWNKKGHKNVP